MATMQRLAGGFDFVDDEPVDLDCGCTAYAGGDYTEYQFDFCGKKKTYTCCEDDDCRADLYFSVLHESMKTGVPVRMLGWDDKHLNTAYEEEMDYADQRYDEDRYLDN